MDGVSYIARRRLATYVGCRSIAVKYVIAGIDCYAFREMLDGLFMVAGSKSCVSLGLHQHCKAVTALEILVAWL